MKFSDALLLVADANTLRYWVALAVLYTGFNAASWLHLPIVASTGTTNLLPLLILCRIVLVILVHTVVNFLGDFYGYMSGQSFYDASLAVSRGYTQSAMLNDTLHSVGLDYGFNFYDGNYEKTRKQAQIDKFEFAIERLEIQRGDAIIDIGCGCGDWISYLKSEWDCTVVGVNITEAQVLECQKRGLECYWSDWKDLDVNGELRAQLYGKFDVVTFWDTVEHYVPMKFVRDVSEQNKIYQRMFEMAQKLLRKGGRNKIWTSCLHMARQVWNRSWKKMMYVYILDKQHSGFYPTYYCLEGEEKRTDQLVDNARLSGIECVWRRNVTYDYYVTSVLEPTHFGRHKFNMNVARFLYLCSWIILDPHWLQRYVWYSLEVWMFQFDTKNIDNSDVILWWLVFENKTS